MGSVSTGTSVWVPGKRIWLRVSAAEDVSGAAAQVDPMGLPFAPSFPQAPDLWEWLLVRGRRSRSRQLHDRRERPLARQPRTGQSDRERP